MTLQMTSENDGAMDTYRALGAVLVACAFEQEPRACAVGYGLNLASWLNASVSVMIMAPENAAPLGMDSTLATTDAARDNARRKAAGDHMAEVARSACQSLALDHEVSFSQASLADSLHATVRLARHFDLSVIDSAAHTGSFRRQMAEGLLSESGRPVIVVPRDPSHNPPRRIVVAWDGSAVAARALHEAIPLLKVAGHAQLVTVMPSDFYDVSGQMRLCVNLSRLGVTTELVTLDGGAAPVTDLLRHHVERVGADLLVAGAYGHSKLREFVLGGVTDALLRDPPVPVLLAH